MSTDINKYTTVVGSGGFGLILKHINKPKVAKLLYNTQSCSDAQIEYTKHQHIYNCLQKFIDTNKLTQIDISKPLSFSNENVFIERNKNIVEFKCYYIMSLLNAISIPKGDTQLVFRGIDKLNIDYYKYHDFNHLIQLIYKEDEYGSTLNKLVGKKYMENVSTDNPERGFFLTTTYIEQLIKHFNKAGLSGDIKSNDDILERMGTIFSIIIFDSEYIPEDSEYVLSMNNDILSVTVLDFGMIKKINFIPDVFGKVEHHLDKIVEDIRTIRDIDLYFPYDTDDNYQYFLKGFKSGFTYSINKENNDTKKHNKSYVFKKFILDEV